MSKRIISLVLTLVLVASCMFCMAGCGGDDTPTAVDLGGRVIKMVSWGANTGGVYVNPEDTSELGQTKVERLAELEEKYNCKFELEIMEAGEILSKFTAAALSGESIGDLICMRNPMVDTAMSRDLLLPLDEYFDFSKPQFSQFAKELTTKDGKTFAFSTETTNHVENALYFNKRIFDDLDLEYPYEMVENKTWTMDVFEDYIEKATVVKNGNTEIYGMYGFLYNGDGLPGFLDAFGAEYAHKTENGYVSGLNDPEMTEALNFVRKHQSETGYIYAPSGNADHTEGPAMFAAGKVAMMMSGVYTAQGGLKEKMSDDFGIVPLPLGAGQTEYAVSEMYENVWVMPASLNPTVAQAIADIITQLHAPLSEDPEEEEENIKRSLENYFCDEESVEMAYMLLTIDGMSVYNHYTVGASDFRSTASGAINDAVHGKTTVASAIGSVSSVWELLLENYNANNGY